jgi:hypothetical protein
MADVDLVSDINTGELDGTAAPAPAGTVPAQGADAVPASAAPAKTEEKPSSLRDQLTAAFKDKDGDPTSQGDATSAERPRDPATGQFIPTPAEVEAAAATAAAATGTGDAIQPPASLTPAEATQFATLPVEMQQLVARNMAVVENAAQRFAGYEGIERVIGERRQAWAMNGMSEAQAINQVFAISDFATRAPADFIRWFAGTQQVDLFALAEQGGDADDIDPVVQELRQQVHDLSSQVNGFTTGQQAAQHNAVVNDVQAFGAEAGTDGKPLRPYFAELGQGLLPYIAAVKAEMPNGSHKEVLAEAYDRACWGTPSVRAKLVAAQEAARLEERRTEAARAKAAGVSVSGQAPAPGSTVPKDIGDGSVRDTLRAAIAQHST